MQLDALGAAAVVVVPAAMAARNATPTDADSAIVVSVTAVEVTAEVPCLILAAAQRVPILSTETGCCLVLSSEKVHSTQ